MCVCVCVCVNLINDWQWSPAALVMCSDQCYKQGVKGLPSASPLNDWPLVQVDGWKCSYINDHVPHRPVARWNEQRRPQPPTTINGARAGLSAICHHSPHLWTPTEHTLNVSVDVYRMFTSLIWKNMQLLMAWPSSSIISGYTVSFLFFLFSVLNEKQTKTNKQNKKKFVNLMNWIWPKPRSVTATRVYKRKMRRIMFLITDINIWSILFARAWMDDLALNMICECRLALHAKLNL